MNHFLYILNRLKPFKYWLLSGLLSNVLMSVFQVASIPLFIPFFELLFGSDKPGSATMTLGNSPSIKEYLQYYLSGMISEKSPQQALFYVILAFLTTFLIKNIFVFLGNYFMAPVRNGFIRDLRKEVYNHMIDLPVLYFKDKKKGDLLSRMSIDMQEIENSIITGIDALIKSPLIILGSIAFMIIVSPQLTSFVLILLPVTIFIIGGVSRRLKQQSSQAQDFIGKLLILMEESIGSIKVIKSFNATNYFQNKFENLNAAYKKILDKIVIKRAVASPLAEVMGVIVISLLMWYAGSLVFKGQFQASAFFAFIYAFFSIIEPAKSFSNAYYSFQKGAAALERVKEILDQKNDIVDAPDSLDFRGFNQSIEFRDVWFRYPEMDDYVLKNISFKIEKGQKIALVGLSGAGKTTLADLISRFYDIEKGQILIDGVDIKNIKIEDLRSLIGIVSQDSLLFNDSVLRNICIGDDIIDIEKLKYSVKSAYIDDFIPDINKLGEIVIGDQGTKLSGGQKQRVAIGRAIYKNAPVLVLDEATSALDSQSEKTVQEALMKVMENRTTLIIAHRLSTVQNVDQIIVLENGEIVEKGTPSELYKKQGIYFKFVQLQQI